MKWALRLSLFYGGEGLPRPLPWRKQNKDSSKRGSQGAFHFFLRANKAKCTRKKVDNSLCFLAPFFAVMFIHCRYNFRLCVCIFFSLYTVGVGWHSVAALPPMKCLFVDGCLVAQSPKQKLILQVTLLCNWFLHLWFSIKKSLFWSFW